MIEGHKENLRPGPAAGGAVAPLAPLVPAAMIVKMKTGLQTMLKCHISTTVANTAPVHPKQMSEAIIFI